jgi:ribokinase
VIKLGAHGSAVFTASEEIFCPAFDVKVTDTTGAGDCFVAGFLAAMSRKSSLAEAGHFGNAVAALSVQKLGAIAGIPDYPHIQAWMESAKLHAPQSSTQHFALQGATATTRV